LERNLQVVGEIFLAWLSHSRKRSIFQVVLVNFEGISFENRALGGKRPLPVYIEHLGEGGLPPSNVYDAYEIPTLEKNNF
jgi:hypothetical protein